MSALSKSYRKVRYDLRPAKQVERLMIIDALRRLSSGGFPIADYQYTGMGSVHFYDFSLFHRYAGINRMLSVEASKAITKRVRFNRPFKSIEIRMEKIGAVIPHLSKALRHMIWLDYDSTIRNSYAADVAQAVSLCKEGSLVLATVDVEPPKGTKATTDIREHYEAEFGNLLPEGLKLNRFTPKNLSGVNAAILWRAIQHGLDGRDGISFEPLFNFLYQDGHRMLTIGGMIVDDELRRRLRSSPMMEAPYLRRTISANHYRIKVPVLTRKERIYLDAAMPAISSWKPKVFEISKRDLKAYCDIYRFAPQFAELIV